MTAKPAAASRRNDQDSPAGSEHFGPSSSSHRVVTPLSATTDHVGSRHHLHHVQQIHSLSKLLDARILDQSQVRICLVCVHFDMYCKPHHSCTFIHITQQTNKDKCGLQPVGNRPLRGPALAAFSHASAEIPRDIFCESDVKSYIHGSSEIREIQKSFSNSRR